MTTLRLSLCLLVTCRMASAQFSPAFLANKSYWGDGKAEVDFYNAELVREGQHYQCELILILAAKFLDSKTFTEPQGPAASSNVPAIEMNELTAFPRGISLEQRSTRAVWRMDTMSLARLSIAGNDGLGQIVKSVSELRDPKTVKWQYHCDGYRDRIDLEEFPPPQGPSVFYDELPLRVRTIDFSKQSGQADIQMFPSLIGTGGKRGEFARATISWKSAERTIEVEVQHAAGTDHFSLDSSFPFLLREWRLADGSHLKMKNSLKAAYWNYLKPGDRERALKDPMLRHPD